MCHVPMRASITCRIHYKTDQVFFVPAAEPAVQRLRLLHVTDELRKLFGPGRTGKGSRFVHDVDSTDLKRSVQRMFSRSTGGLGGGRTIAFFSLLVCLGEMCAIGAYECASVRVSTWWR